MNRRAFTLIELMIVVSLLITIAAILLPAFVTAREAARGASCLCRERQLGLALACYTQDYEEALPLYADCISGRHGWFEVLQPYTAGPALFGCPSVATAPLPAGLGYGVDYLGVIRYNRSCSWNLPGTGGPAYESEFDRPAETLWLADAGSSALSDPFYVGMGADPGFVGRHNGRANLLFLDGHARAFLRAALTDPHLWGHD